MTSIRSSNITLTRLRAFAGVIDTGSFTAAADMLGMTQSGVSQALSGLEDALGAPLVLRDREGVMPTGIGLQALNDARAVLQSVERMQQRCSAFRGLQAGAISIGSVTSAAARILPQVLKSLCSQHPALKISVIEGTDPEVADWTQAGIVDLGITAEKSEGLTQTAIAQDEYVAVLHKNHPLAKHKRITLEELGDVPFVMPGASCEPPILAMFEEAGVAPQVVCTVRGTVSLLDMVRVGMGTTLVPELSLPEQVTEYMAVKLHPPVVRTLYAVYDSKISPTPSVEAILSLLQATSGLQEGPTR